MAPAAAGGAGRAQASSRLHELEQKRVRYEHLAQKLFTLPHKLRHPGLIPVGPRLFLPGELVNTNRYTVLLGSCGDDAYYAERSALQAQGIVQRRLALIGERAREVLVPAEVVREVLQGEALQGEALQGARGEGCAPQDLKGGESDGVEEVQVQRDRVRKRVSFREPVVTHMYEPDKAKKKKGKKGSRNSKLYDSFKTRAPTSSLAQATTTSETKKAYEQVPLHGGADVLAEKSSTVEKGDKAETAHRVQSELDAAIRAAEQKVLEQGVVNITEVFEDGADGPSRVELPKGFTPDANVSFEDDSEEFLDMTGARATQSTKAGDAATREDYLEALMAAEHEEELEASRVAGEDSAQRIRKEAREFGQGFAKGFFGAAAAARGKGAARGGPKQAAVGESAGETADVSNGGRGGGEGEGEGGARAAARGVPEHVVERRRGRGHGRARARSRTRQAGRARASSILDLRGMPVAGVIPDVHGVDARPEDDGAPEMSRFRELRLRERGGADA